MLRSLHTFHDVTDHGPLLAELDRVRGLEGCDSAELYRGLAEGEDFTALTLTWDDEEALDAFWARVLAGEMPELLRRMAGSAPGTGVHEFYRCERFAMVDGAWLPEAAAGRSRAVQWPARGEVRVLIQNAVQASEEMYARIRDEIAETRREPGCLSYTWCENVELPGHLLLEEVWASQVIYDRHWALRLATADFLGDNLRTPATPQRGPLAREFYRRQCFTHLYNHWQPVDPDALATTIVWPAG